MRPTENGVYSLKTLTRMFTAALVIIAPDREHFQRQSAVRREKYAVVIQSLYSNEDARITITQYR